MLLWGVHYPLIRVLEGYWLIAPRLPDREPARGDPSGWWNRSTRVGRVKRFVLGPLRLCNRLRLALGKWKKGRWVRTRAHLSAVKNQPERSDERTAAATELTARFPNADDFVLPTELGNVIRAFETHPRDRYGLDGIPIWPSIQTMLTDAELADIDEKTTDVAFWLNSLTVVVIGGALLLAEKLWHRPGNALETTAIEFAIAIAVVLMAGWMYRQLIGAAARWGEGVRAAFDVHRFELYKKLGIRMPFTPEEDVDAGRAVNRLLAFGEPVPLEWRAESTPDSSPEAS